MFRSVNTAHFPEQSQLRCSVYTLKVGTEFLNTHYTRFVYRRPDSCCKLLYYEVSSFSAFTFLLIQIW